MTRSRLSDQCRSLALHRTTLSFATPRRFNPAHKEGVTMKKLMLAVGAFGVLWLIAAAPVPPAAHAHDRDDQDREPGRHRVERADDENTSKDFVPPTVFQAAGPTAASIQSTVDAFRAALGNPNNGNASGPLPSGRREINWDGGGANATTDVPVTPFNVFLNTRGAQFATPGTGLSQTPPSGGPQGGLAVLFNNPSYANIFRTFSPLRLFVPVGSNITDALFFLPGSNGTLSATVAGFGAIFTDVDQPDGSGPANKRGDRGASTLIRYFGADGRLLFSSFVPASPGDGNLSFFGIVFDDARIARVQITTGNVALGPDDSKRQD